ncbi:adenylate/guanylate cyclase domain-containing protein [Stappia sp. F7233]|uniref:Adenylate/guanylate cyclase domain-containing protein n=1 Tax=Stappia albiluteola TaxID=2758565 RepID=A0A839ADV3_9HYPH|nr:adenylate/guanylate cyclase domain-containing protein [Stappia albiluteola]MBA5777092.1 adenylate/guanylate cyclase domain-containing protein [Stappia albiluteola]
MFALAIRRLAAPLNASMPAEILGRLLAFVFGQRPPRELPERVRRAIAADQRSSEILVSIAQFGAIAFFGGFYAITPKAFPPSVPFEPVPIALTIYFVVTALRLRLALTGKLTPLFLSLSVVIDIAVLMITIWSFHLQYQQPATIYLKAPTLLYVFILIALRAMRFEAGYIVLAGLAAVVGWLLLVAYAVLTAGEMRLTHNFAVYMTSDTILIGAEIDKILSFVAVTAVLAIAVVRARRLLIRAATEAHAANELSRFFAPEVAGEIRATHSGFMPGDAMIRDAAVLMLDLRGFTRLAARLTPEETMALLRDYQRVMVPVIQANGGSIDKYLGDGIMATFGAARPSENFAADAFRALDGICEAANAWNDERAARHAEPLRIGAALAVGPVLFGVTGDDSRLEFTVIGNVVNLAAKLEKHCKVAGRDCLATREAYELAARQGYRPDRAYSVLRQEEVAGTAPALDLVARDTKPA